MVIDVEHNTILAENRK